MNLKEQGIDVGFAVAGLFGSLLLMSSTASMNVGRTLLATVGGAASANYVTPLILHITKLGDDPTYSYAVAFLLGYGGLRVVETLTSKIITDAPSNTSKRRR